MWVYRLSQDPSPPIGSWGEREPYILGFINSGVVSVLREKKK